MVPSRPHAQRRYPPEQNVRGCLARDACGLRSRRPPQGASGYQLLQKSLNRSGDKLGVAHRMLDILVPEIRLQRPGIVAFVGEGEPAGVPQHVRVRREAEPGGLAGALYKPGEAARGERRASLAGEHEGDRFLLTLQPAQCPQLVAQDRMRRRGARLTRRTASVARWKSI